MSKKVKEKRKSRPPRKKKIEKIKRAKVKEKRKSHKT